MKLNNKISLVVFFLILFAGFSATNVRGQTLNYSTYLGGSGIDSSEDLAVDSNGNVYVIGWTSSINFPVINAIQNAYGGGDRDVFVTKYSPEGNVIYSTFLGGSGRDEGQAVAVDSFGNAYITGETYSSDFPLLNPVQGTYYGGEIFLAKLSPTGSLLYSTYFGGPSVDEVALDIAVDTSGKAYLTGTVTGSNFPVYNAYQSTYTGGGNDAFIVKFDSTLSNVIYSTYLGGSNVDIGRGIAVDSFGNAYVVGETSSTDFPLSQPLQASISDKDAFVTKISSDGTVLMFSSFIGGKWQDQGTGIAVDESGNVYFVGQTGADGYGSEDLPVVNALQPQCAKVTLPNGDVRCINLFVGKINGSTYGMDWLTYLGGSGSQQRSFRVSLGNNNQGVYITGDTNALNFPVYNPIQANFRGGFDDAFITRISTDGSRLSFSTYLGGSGSDVGKSVGVDSLGNVFVTGLTNSTDFPVVNPQQPNSAGGLFDMFVSKIFPDNTASGSGVEVIESGAILTFSQVESGGETTITISSSGTQPPSGFKLGSPATYYNISTTAEFTGNVAVCFNYNDATIQGNESNLKLMHFDGQRWINITTSLDTIANIICGTTTSFSDFALMTEPTIDDLVNLVGTLNLQQGIENSLDVKLQRAFDAQTAEKNNSITEAVNALNAFISEVEAQRGNKITDSQANDLHSLADNLIKIVQGVSQF